MSTPSAPSAPPTEQTESVYGIPAEAHLLEQVIVHTPGQEMELVAPDNRAELLFDDILFLGHARKEHLLMCSVFEKIVGRPDTVLQIGELLSETFQKQDARHAFVEKLCRSLPEQNLGAVEKDLKELSPEEIGRAHV